MTDAEINVAIAEACGWSRVYLWQDYGGNSGRKELCGNHKLFGNDWRIPDYCHDLNAMHDAEKSLDDNARLKYALALMGLVGFTNVFSDRINEKMAARLCWATAQQRAEAFLRTIGKWKENAGAAV